MWFAERECRASMTKGCIEARLSSLRTKVSKVRRTWSCRDLPRRKIGPNGHFADTFGNEGIGQGRDMMNKLHLAHGHIVYLRLVLYIELRVRKHASRLPRVDSFLSAWCKATHCLLRRIRLVLAIRGCALHVVASNLVLCAVSTTGVSVTSHGTVPLKSLPLRESLVTTNVSALAGLASFATFGVTATRWTSTAGCHCECFDKWI